MGAFLAIGEVMIELADAGSGLLKKGFAGDSFNTAYYARAILPSDWQVEYFTALGDDPASADIINFMKLANIGSHYVRTIKGSRPGLYMIHLDKGERSFSYWRDTSAAKRLADDQAALKHAIKQADMIYFSGITLAILPPEGREILMGVLLKAKASGKPIAFDPNLRPRLWQSLEEMTATITQAARAATIVLPGLDDEMAYFGDADRTATLVRYHGLPVENIVLKDGENGVTLSLSGQITHLPAHPATVVVDTTGAGDSFNGAYLARLLVGDNPIEAAEFATRIAARVISHPGALIGQELLLS